MNITSVDIETTGLDPWTDKITCVGVWTPKESHVLREDFSPLLNLDSSVVGQNFKFDLKFLEQNGIDLLSKYEWDTQLMAHICTEKIPDSWLEIYEYRRRKANKKLPQGFSHRMAGRYSLKTLAPYFLDVEPFWETPDNHDNDIYVLKDCQYTYELMEVLRESLEKQESIEFYKKVLSWNKMLYKMEVKGIELDFQALQETEEEYEEIKRSLEIEVRKQWNKPIRKYYEDKVQAEKEKYDSMLKAALAKLKDESKKDKTVSRYESLKAKAISKVEHFNLASSTQMKWLLNEQLGYDLNNSEGDISTQKSVLNRLFNEGKTDIETYLHWRDADKVLSMYLPAYKELNREGIIHPTFNIAGTRTGRLSCSSPNLQQVPSKLYKLFKPREGKKFIQYDLSGIEAALIALYSGDENLFKILKDGHSIHDYNTITFFDLDCDPSEVALKYPKHRKTSKTIGFAIFYGGGSSRIKEAFLQNDFPITEQEAKNKLRAFRKFYQGATDFHKEISEVFESGQTIRNLFDRPVKIQSWESAYMNGFNTLVQSSASDLNIRACEKAVKRWEESEVDCYPLLLIHDCILAESSAEHSEAASKILKECMTGFTLSADLGNIELKVEGGISDRWEK